MVDFLELLQALSKCVSLRTEFLVTLRRLSRNNRSIFEQNPPAPLSPKGARGEWIRNYNPLSLGSRGERVARSGG